MLKSFFLISSVLLIFGCASQGDFKISPKLKDVRLQSNIKNSKVNLDARLERLKYGVGFGEIFRDPDSDTEDYYTKFINQQDISFLKKLGIKHVRIAVNPDFLVDKNSSDYLNHKFLGYVDRFIDTMNKNDIAVVFDVHPKESAEYEKIENIKILKRIWLGLAQYYSSYDPDMLFFEILNEPIFGAEKSADWLRIQEDILKIIRKKAPYHTVILSGPDWGGLDGLMKLKPLKDKNVVYSFHFYEPDLFTHQGAERSENFSGLRDIKYPYDLSYCKNNILSKFQTGSKAWNDIKWYCENTPSTKDQIKTKIKTVVDWAQKNDIKLYMGEFGVYTDYTDKESKIRRYEDMKSIIQEINIGRSVWGYTRCFGLGVIKDSQYNITSYDHDVTKILFNDK